MSKNYYLMFADSEWSGPTVEVVDVPNVRATKGRVIGELEKPFKVNLVFDSTTQNSKDFSPLDFHESAKFRLFSRRFINLLESLGIDNIEYFPAEVFDSHSKKNLDYCVGNVLGKVNCVDEAASELDMDPDGFILQIQKMVLDESKIEGFRLFWMGEKPLILVAHRTIKEAVEKQGMTGLFFVSDDEYEPGMI